MSKWDHRPWRKLYCAELGSFAQLPLYARALAAELLKFTDEQGRIFVGKRAPWEAVARLCGADAGDRRLLKKHLPLLLEDGYLVARGEFLIIRNQVAAQSRKGRRKHVEETDLEPIDEPEDGERTVHEPERTVHESCTNDARTGTSGARVVHESDASGARVVHEPEPKTDVTPRNDSGPVWGREEKRREEKRGRNEEKRSARPSNLREALELPIRERAAVLVEDPHMAGHLQPHKWPEVVDVAQRFSAAMGWHEPRLTSATHSAVRKLVEVLSAFDADELDRAIVAAPTDDWLNDGRKGLSALTPEVVGRLLNPKRSRPASRGRVPQSNHGLTGLEGVEEI
ncbi:MAG: hypothetical protein DIU78_018955 [Pseudomonadota bacterium]